MDVNGGGVLFALIITPSETDIVDDGRLLKSEVFLMKCMIVMIKLEQMTGR